MKPKFFFYGIIRSDDLRPNKRSREFLMVNDAWIENGKLSLIAFQLKLFLESSIYHCLLYRFRCRITCSTSMSCRVHGCYQLYMWNEMCVRRIWPRGGRMQEVQDRTKHRTLFNFTLYILNIRFYTVASVNELSTIRKVRSKPSQEPVFDSKFAAHVFKKHFMIEKIKSSRKFECWERNTFINATAHRISIWKPRKAVSQQLLTYKLIVSVHLDCLLYGNDSAEKHLF